ncbi:MAG: DUF3578 domain-containing protein [Bacilli bacterium]|nr:DUF3578 domain-containing protein [Bacilli bacterium]
MKDKIEVLMNEYLSDSSTNVDSNKNYYKVFVKELPEYLYRYFDSNKYLIKASVGVGQRSEIPWVCIFNKGVTKSATNGIYICYLFRKDMSGFYLELGQGITTFEELYGKDKNKNVDKVANYFKSLIDSEEFNKDAIDLRGKKELSKGYEHGTIISKYYEKDGLDEEELINDLNTLKKIYDDICDNLVDQTYMDIVNNVIQNMDPSSIVINQANAILDELLFEETDDKDAEIITLEQVDIPTSKKKNKYSGIRKKTIKKIDQMKKSKTNAKNGLLGEQLVMAYEQDRLNSIGRGDLAEKIKWISKDDDTIGYDILSFDIDENSNVVEKYIEVKTTEGPSDSVFYISANEIGTMNKFKNLYYIYRVFKVKTKKPEVFVLNYSDFKDKIELKVSDYVAGIKEV